jgi:hypothetical protein
MKSKIGLGSLLKTVTAQGRAFERRAQSVEEKRYSDAMLKAAAALTQFTRTATFDELIGAEQAFQENDLTIYAQRPGTVKSVREGMDDLEAGMMSYRQLMTDTEAYKKHGYRKKEMVDPKNGIPLDAMRRALRGQVRRVENYRANVMGNSNEQTFMTARIEMLHRAEELYDAMQRERLSPPEQETA